MEDEGLWNEIDLIVNENEEASSSHSSSSLRKHVKRSLQVITDAIRLYGVAALAISFNGGKDATISLHLLRYALYQQNLLDHLSRSIPLIYFHDPQTFPEMELFLNETKEKYQLEYLTFHCSYKEGMKHLVEDRGIRAVIMGVRKGDPYSEEAEHLTPSSSNWPAFMRIYPLLNWKFSHGTNLLFLLVLLWLLCSFCPSSVVLHPHVSYSLLLSLRCGLHIDRFETQHSPTRISSCA
jgi:3'-phosphoadenosine 5'-phosphosulfate sulfotransferase (PAPS reductase)/FAD synthetase